MDGFREFLMNQVKEHNTTKERAKTERAQNWMSSIGCHYDQLPKASDPLNKSTVQNNFWQMAEVVLPQAEKALLPDDCKQIIFTPEAREALVTLGMKHIKGKKNYPLLRTYLAGAIFAGATGNRKHKWGTTNLVLQKAIKHNDAHLVELALSRGANSDACNDKKTPLLFNANPTIGKLLLHYGATIETKDPAGYTLLHFVVPRGELSYCSDLLTIARFQKKLPKIINAKQENQVTPLHCLVQIPDWWQSVNEVTKIVDLLIDHGASVFSRDEKHDAAQDMALKTSTSKKISDEKKKIALEIFKILREHRQKILAQMPQEQQCTICLEDNVSPKSELQQLWCGHTFCTDCVLQAFAEKQACPNCRIAIRPSDIR